mmetsp:Transcript_1878/g.4974  ORF Transcript_1878/g.4974 Transcript_1878/m.4974 type:complete len:223 (-) Transcript_1878:85-753(-)
MVRRLKRRQLRACLAIRCDHAVHLHHQRFDRRQKKHPFMLKCAHSAAVPKEKKKGLCVAHDAAFLRCALPVDSLHPLCSRFIQQRRPSRSAPCVLCDEAARQPRTAAATMFHQNPRLARGSPKRQRARHVCCGTHLTWQSAQPHQLAVHRNASDAIAAEHRLSLIVLSLSLLQRRVAMTQCSSRLGPSLAIASSHAPPSFSPALDDLHARVPPSMSSQSPVV